ncbi:hypothetical protein [Nocardia farcinica]|uniref:hypothetical protein n=1 Tax=Nocardia farcinica TaxID=37329 RepID=UPI001E29CB77|nr:hypothetical protein [Nocardia farcinica]
MTLPAPDLSPEPSAPALEIGGRPASVPLQNTDRVASTMVGHFASTAPCRTLPGEQLRGDVTKVTRFCLALAAEMFEHAPYPPPTSWARSAKRPRSGPGKRCR